MTTYYFCDNQTGCAPGCPVGSNVNPGTSSSAPKQNLTGFTFPSGQHSFLFAKGGAWTGLATIAPLSGTSEAARTLFGSFDHPSFSSSAMPILNAAAATGLFNFNKVNYFEIANLDLRGASDNAFTKGVVLANGRGVYLHNNRISGFGFGVHGSDGDGSSPTADFQISNNEIDHNYSLGFEGGGDRFLIESNNFHHNGSADGLDHNVYVGSTNITYDNIVIRGNTLTFNQQFSGSISKSVALVAHGTVKNLLIEENYIEDLSTGYGHYGISVDGVTSGTNNPQHFPGLIIRGNKIVVAGFSTIGIHWTCATDAIIENNAIVHLNSASDEYFRGIMWDSDTVNTGRGDTVGSNSLIRNNSIYIAFNNAAPPSQYTAGIEAGTLGNGGDSIINNIIHMSHASGATSMYALKYNGRAAGAFTTIANNIAYSPTVTITWSDASSTPPGGEPNSSIADPMLVTTPSAGNSYSLALQSGSPAVNAGHSTKSSRTAYARYMPISTRDIGAYEYNATVVGPMGVSGGNAN